MKAFNKIACSFLAIAVVMGLTACAAKTFDHQKLTGLCKSAKLEESSDFDEYYKTYRKVSSGSKKENGAYFTGTKSDAQNVYDNVLNLFEGLPSHDVEEATTFISSDDDGMFAGFVFTLEASEEAEKLFEEYSAAYIGNGNNGKEKGYVYSISSSESKSGRTDLNGVYLKENTVLILRGMSEDTGFAKKFCKTFGVRSPA